MKITVEDHISQEMGEDIESFDIDDAANPDMPILMIKVGGKITYVHADELIAAIEAIKKSWEINYHVPSNKK
jgi:hypothetical protein